jgi:hypothetical protein
MINHTNCDHPSTSSARGKCRKARAAGGEYKGTGATPKELDLSKAATSKFKDNYGQTPRDRDKQCDVCGVEKIAWRGLDVISGVVLYVGDKCFYMVKQDPNGAVELA